MESVMRRGQFNNACQALGLDWDIDGTVCRGNGGGQCDRDIVRAYIASHRPHLLSCYEPDFLVEMILAQKERTSATGGVAVEPYTPL